MSRANLTPQCLVFLRIMKLGPQANGGQTPGPLMSRISWLWLGNNVSKVIHMFHQSHKGTMEINTSPQALDQA
jgi:hypothetical protein